MLTNTPIVGGQGTTGFSGGPGQTVSETSTDESLNVNSFSPSPGGISPSVTGGAGGTGEGGNGGSGGGATLLLTGDNLGEFVSYGVGLTPTATGGMGANEFSQGPGAGAIGGDGGAAETDVDQLSGTLGNVVQMVVAAYGGSGGYGGSGEPGGAGGSGSDANATLSNSSLSVEGHPYSVQNALVIGVDAYGGNGGAGAAARAGNGGPGGAGGNASVAVTGNILSAGSIEITTFVNAGAGAPGGASSGINSGEPYQSGPPGDAGAALLVIADNTIDVLPGAQHTSQAVGPDSLLTLVFSVSDGNLPLSGKPGGNLVFIGNVLTGDGNSTLDLENPQGSADINTVAGTLSIDGSPGNKISGFDVFQVTRSATFETGPGTYEVDIGDGVITAALTPSSGNLTLTGDPHAGGSGPTASNLVLDLTAFGASLDSLAQLEADQTSSGVIDLPGGGTLTLDDEGIPQVSLSALDIEFAPVPQVTLGSGSSTLALFVAERAAPAGAQFTISVDGAQVGGVQTTTANSLAGRMQQYDVLGNFMPGVNTVSIDYLNAANSLLFVDSAALNGSPLPNSAVTLSNDGAAKFSFVATGALAPVAVGSGPDTLVLTLSERALPGSEFTVSVDGKQIGGTQTVSASTLLGQTEAFDVEGSFAAGSHTATIDYLDASNSLLLVDGASIDGAPVANSALVLSNIGTGSFSFTALGPNAPATIGAGPDDLALQLSQRAEPAGAQFTVSVDGAQVGGVQTVTADSTAGQAQELDVRGTFAPGPQTVALDYLNANNSLLSLDSATINGATIAGAPETLSNNGSSSFSFITPSAPAPTALIAGPGSDVLAISVSEDYLRANTNFTVSVDGQQVSGVQTAAAIEGNGQSQLFDIAGSFSGAHSVSINLLNSATNGGAAGALYVGSAAIDGSPIASSALTLTANGAQSFMFTH